jgi:SAM-dependent methyltransferase
MKTKKEILAWNKEAWNREVERGNRWSIPADPWLIASARRGDWHIVLTPEKPVPADWFPPLPGCRVLCLASGGGQQGPILAAAGAIVTVLDNSPRMLAQDRHVAEREGLEIRTEEGDMADLSAFGDASFDFIVHPVSNCFAPDVRPVWREAFRVLRPGGSMIAGFNNPLLYTFDVELEEQGVFQLRYRLPFSDVTDMSEAERVMRYGVGAPLEFGHTLSDQIGGQLDAGFVITGFYEDRWPGEKISEFLDIFIATRALKPQI